MASFKPLKFEVDGLGTRAQLEVRRTINPHLVKEAWKHITELNELHRHWPEFIPCVSSEEGQRVKTIIDMLGEMEFNELLSQPAGQESKV